MAAANQYVAELIGGGTEQDSSGMRA